MQQNNESSNTNPTLITKSYDYSHAQNIKTKTKSYQYDDFLDEFPQQVKSMTEAGYYFDRLNVYHPQLLNFPHPIKELLWINRMALKDLISFLSVGKEYQ